jgi:hypothetical protein
MQNYATSDAIEFSSSEATTIATRPKLTITYLPASPLRAAGLDTTSASLGESPARLTEADAAALLPWAVASWGLPASPLPSVRVTDLPGDLLAAAAGGFITLDVDAAGAGWYVDPSPWESSEFASQDQGGADQVAGCYDLLSVISHEVGHGLGLDHGGEGAMQDRLPPATRRLPDAGDAAWENFDFGLFSRSFDLIAFSTLDARG